MQWAEGKHWKIETIVFSYDLKKGRFWDLGKANSSQQPERHSEYTLGNRGKRPIKVCGGKNMSNRPT